MDGTARGARGSTALAGIRRTPAHARLGGPHAASLGSPRLGSGSRRLDCDGDVDGADLGILLGTWGSGDEAADLDGDGVVGGGDLGILLGDWTG